MPGLGVNPKRSANMSKRAASFLPLAFAALLLAGCGGGTPEDVANEVLAAIQAGEFDNIYLNYPPHSATARKLEQDRERHQAAATEDWWVYNRDRMTGAGVSLDPEVRLEIKSESDYFRLTPEQRTALHDNWYKHAHRWERFEDRLNDLRLTSISESHWFEGGGTATVTYRNRFNDTLIVQLVRFRGTWYANDVSLRGRDFLPTRNGNES
jgi:hypothetical protein